MHISWAPSTLMDLLFNTRAVDPDPDPEFQVNPESDPDPILIQFFCDQKLKKKI
jgi:hypothetical protein